VYLPPNSSGWKVTAKDTLGAYAFAESTVQPQTGPEPHRHSREDEAFYVLDGQLEIRVGERVMVAAPGAFVSAPRGIPHTFKNVGTTPAKVLVILAPAGLEKFFEEREALTKELATTDPAYSGRYKALAEKYGLEYSSDWSLSTQRKRVKSGWAKGKCCLPIRAMMPNHTLERDAHCARAPQCSALTIIHKSQKPFESTTSG
jgi:quercetin dioxygenase-like cupin family protein